MTDATHPSRETRGSDRGRLITLPVGHQPASQPNNLPLDLSSFVGREKELAEVRRLLEEARLLTLTGSGGCGKTRLALAVAGELAEEFEDGVWFVELASLSDPSLVPQAVASVLGAREQPGRLSGDYGTHFPPAVRTLIDYEGRLAAARSQLDEVSLTAAWDEGRAMSPEQAVEYEQEQDPEPTAPEPFPAGLSAREVEVLRLVATGMTDAEVAK